MADKPVVQFTLASIRKDIKKVEVLRVGVSGSKTVTFPDLMAMQTEESDVLLEKLSARGKRTWSLLEEWLSAEDVNLLRAEKLTRAELLTVIGNASKYYEHQYGDLGNDTASASF